MFFDSRFERENTILFGLYFVCLKHLGTNSNSYRSRYLYMCYLQCFPLWWYLYLTSDIEYRQNNARSLHDFRPRLSSGFRSLMASDSKNDNFSQLSERLMISVFCLTQLIWNCIRSISCPPVWKIPTIFFHSSQVWKCLQIALSFCDHPCSLVLLKRVLSVFPM